MIFALAFFVALGGAYLYRQKKGSPQLRKAAMLLMFAGCFLFGWQAATWKERLKVHEEYIWRFSRYSGMMRSLAERQEIEDLTNAVILFDQRFNARKDPQELADVLREILNNDPSWKSAQTNSAEPK